MANVRPESINVPMRQIHTLLKQVELDAAGYDADIDGEVWEWLEADDILTAHRVLGEVAEKVEAIRNRLIAKLGEFHINN